jgi:diaminobutyrate acetyltransferase
MHELMADQAGGNPGPARFRTSLPAPELREPVVADGPAVHDLIAACPPLDRNSLYCNLLQCSDFAGTCILAERGGQAVGWVSGYRPPAEPATLFVWQVAVHPSARGLGLARRMILSLLVRPTCRGVRRIRTTITPDNAPSWALFSSVASGLRAPIRRDPGFDAEAHFRGAHASEDMVTIGEFAPPPH